MKNIKLLITAIALWTSCDKLKVEPLESNSLDTNNPSAPKNFTPMQIGNYWIYAEYRIDPNGDESLIGTDSIYIARDIFINGNRYFVFDGNEAPLTPSSDVLRDSMGYLVNEKGQILFSTVNYEEVLCSGVISGVCSLYSKMTEKDKRLTIPAGTVTTSNYQTTYNFNNGSTHYANTYYANKVGRIQYSYFFITDPSTIYVRKLLRCKIMNS